MRTMRAGAAAALVCGVLAGCAGGPVGPSPTGTPVPTTTRSASASPTSSGGSSTPLAPTSTPTPTSTVLRATTTHGWGIPTAAAPFTTTHVIHPPIAAPPAPPLPCLLQVAVGRHTGYDQVSFRFSGAMPGYRIAYGGPLVAPGSGAIVPLAGRSVLQVRFSDAQAHDERGRSSIESLPARPVRLPAIVDLALAGDFEGRVLWGVGVGVSPAAGLGPGRVRVVEIERVDAGHHLFIVAVQVASR